MVTYTSAFLAVANLLALAHAAPAQPVCSVVTTVITGKPIWVPRADPTTAAGWSDWQGKGSSSSSTKKTTTTTSYVSIPTTWTNGGGFYTASTSTWSTSSIPVISITVTPTTWSTTTDVPTTTPVVVTPTTSSAPPPAATCAASGISTFEADGVSGSCGCEFAVTCNMHAPYTADTSFWERTSGEIIGSLAECQAICNDNAACTAAIWVNKDGAPSSEYMRCWQTSNLPQPNDDGYGQLSYKGSCSGSCSSSYNS